MAEATDANWKDSICGQCGESIVDPWDDEQRKPCPKCGSLTRRIVVEQRVQLESLATNTATATAQVEIVAFRPRILLDLASGLMNEGRFELAIVVVHTACEIATEQTLSKAFDARGVQDLKDWVMGRLTAGGYNLANDRIRSLYTALTGDEVQKQPAFWSKFKASAKRRNKIIHRGATAEKADAEDSYKAANDLLAHLKK
jgi:hypothetical protein